MTLTCRFLGHTTMREFRKDAQGYDVLHLVCSRCGFATLALGRSRQERIDLLKKYRRIAAPKAQTTRDRSAVVVDIRRAR